VDASQPSVVFAGLDAQGKDTVLVSVKIDGQAAARELDARAVPLDPGRHEFEFTSADGQLRRVSLVLREAEKRRRVVADFRVSEAKAAPAPAQTPTPAAPAATSDDGPSTPVAVYVLGGIGLAGLGSFAYFAASGRSIQKNELDPCKPHCQGKEDRISEMRTRYVIADISLGVAVASLGVGTYLLFASKGESPRAARGVRIDVGVGQSSLADLTLSASGRF